MGENDDRAMPSAPATPEPSLAVSALRGGIGIAAHTPGPWGIEQTRDMLWVGPMRADGRKVDSVVVGLNIDSELTPTAALRQYRNARLIAAAPALYEALEDFDNWFCGFNPEDRASRMEGRKVVIRARAALVLASTDRELEA